MAHNHALAFADDADKRQRHVDVNGRHRHRCRSCRCRLAVIAGFPTTPFCKTPPSSSSSPLSLVQCLILKRFIIAVKSANQLHRGRAKDAQTWRFVSFCFCVCVCLYCVHIFRALRTVFLFRRFFLCTTHFRACSRAFIHLNISYAKQKQNDTNSENKPR